MFYEEKPKKDRHQLKTREGNSIWDGVEDDWTCPSCSRGKFEILRQRGDRKVGGLHRHHDHAVEWDERNHNERVSFTETIICDQCNHAEGLVKKMYPNVIPEDFSFSPIQIKKFVVGKPNKKHRVNLVKALEVFFEFVDVSYTEFHDELNKMSGMTDFESSSIYRRLVKGGYPPSEYLILRSQDNNIKISDLVSREDYSPPSESEE